MGITCRAVIEWGEIDLNDTMQPVINLKWLVAVEVILQNLKDIVSIILFRDVTSVSLSSLALTLSSDQSLLVKSADGSLQGNLTLNAGIDWVERKGTLHLLLLVHFRDLNKKTFNFTWGCSPIKKLLNSASTCFHNADLPVLYLRFGFNIALYFWVYLIFFWFKPCVRGEPSRPLSKRDKFIWTQWPLREYCAKHQQQKRNKRQAEVSISPLSAIARQPPRIMTRITASPGCFHPTWIMSSEHVKCINAIVEVAAWSMWLPLSRSWHLQPSVVPIWWNHGSHWRDSCSACRSRFG